MQVHVKDLDGDGNVVPAGFGRAGWPALIQALRRDGYHGLVSLEPHLLRAGPGGGFTGPTLFAEAHRALKALITSNRTRSVPATKDEDTVATPLSAVNYAPPSENAWAARGCGWTGWPFLACVNGLISSPDEVPVAATEEGFLRGEGAFEVLRVYTGRPFELNRHMDRFARTCESMLLDFPRDEILADLAALLTEAGAVDCLWRGVVARGGTRLQVLEWLPPEKRHGVPLTLKSIRYQPTVGLSDLKSMSYGANAAASRRARSDGAYEGLLIHPDGSVLEAPTGTVFWAKEGILKTPVLENATLPSITRAVLMEALETEEVSATIGEVRAADEVLLASTSRGIQPVRRVDDAEYEEAPGPFCRAARRALGEALAHERRSAEAEG
jgi:branched-chain amino acid aminotransferase